MTREPCWPLWATAARQNIWLPLQQSLIHKLLSDHSGHYSFPRQDLGTATVADIGATLAAARQTVRAANDSLSPSVLSWHGVRYVLDVAS